VTVTLPYIYGCKCCRVSCLLHSNCAMVCNLCFFVRCQLQIEILCIIEAMQNRKGFSAIFDHKMASELSDSSVADILCLVSQCHSQKWGLPKSVDRGPLDSFCCYYACSKWLATVLWATLSTVRPWKAACYTKVVRPKSYWGSRCTYSQGLKRKDCQSSTNFCYHIILSTITFQNSGSCRLTVP